MNGHDLLSIRLTDNFGLSIDAGPVLLILLALGALGWIIYARRFRRLAAWSVIEAEIELGGIGKVKIRPSYEEIQIAYQVWVELVTRKAAVPFQEDYDLISQVYDSWYALFLEVRKLVKTIPAEKIRSNKDTQELVQILVDALNYGIRPHLTRWQAKFRHWYDEAVRKNPDKSPQEIQRQYPHYRELVDDLMQVNKELIQYAGVIRQIAYGK